MSWTDAPLPPPRARAASTPTEAPRTYESKAVEPQRPRSWMDIRSIPRCARCCAPVALKEWPESRRVPSLFLFSCPVRSAPSMIVCTTAALETALPPKVGKRVRMAEAAREDAVQEIGAAGTAAGPRARALGSPVAGGCCRRCTGVPWPSPAQRCLSSRPEGGASQQPAFLVRSARGRPELRRPLSPEAATTPPR